jgi:hypothetical protein
MARIHRIGAPENKSEAKAIRALAEGLPDTYQIVHNFELTTGRGMPYEYDMAVVGEYAVYHIEVKGYRGRIRGNHRHWIFENGAVYPSPIPLANKKTKILAGRLRDRERRLGDVFVETVILLADEKARVRLRDPQASRVVHLDHAADYLTDPEVLPIRPSPIEHLHDPICGVLLGTRPSKKVSKIGLYDIIEKINQTDTRTVFLAKHRYIHTRPKTIIKVFHFDIYASDEEKERQIQAIFHDQDAMRLLSVHPNIIVTGDMFAWEDNKFVLPTEYIENGRTLEMLLDKEEDRQLTWSEKRRIIAKVALGLRHCHRAGVIMRDIRPLNVVVAPTGEVKLVNFDLAHIRSAPNVSDPRNLRQRLHPGYIAPEVWLDLNSADKVSDVYSLGIVFYELITSRQPYTHIEAVIQAGAVPLDMDLLLHELSSPGSEDFMRSPADAAHIIKRMCAYDRSERYPNMDEVIEDLEIVGD